MNTNVTENPTDGEIPLEGSGFEDQTPDGEQE